MTRRSDLYVDPGGAFITYKGNMFYRDGVLYGTVLPEADTVMEHSIPTLWSSIVVKYRKKPVEVEAIQLMSDNAEEVAVWCGGVVIEEIDPVDSDKKWVGINIPTLEGVMRASEDDYIIKGTKGEFYPCKPAIFVDIYDLA